MELVSGTPVAFQATATTPAAGQEGLPTLPAPGGDTKTIVGTLKALRVGIQFKSGPPLWPVGLLRIASDNGQSDYLIVRKGAQTTRFYDVEGKEIGDFDSGIAQAKKTGRKVKVLYVPGPAHYATKVLAVAVYYLD
jgi:hypothetical protein